MCIHKGDYIMKLTKKEFKQIVSEMVISELTIGASDNAIVFYGHNIIKELNSLIGDVNKVTPFLIKSIHYPSKKIIVYKDEKGKYIVYDPDVVNRMGNFIECEDVNAFLKEIKYK